MYLMCDSIISKDYFIDMHSYSNDLQKWIGNERKRRRHSGATDQQSKRVKLPPMQRGPNAYNIFCAEIFRTGKFERNALIFKQP